VEETFARSRVDTSKSVASTRTIALGSGVADELFEHRARSRYSADEDRVFCHLATGGPLDHKRYAETLGAALKRAGIEDEVRPFHDGRHTSITNAAAAGVAPGCSPAPGTPTSRPPSATSTSLGCSSGTRPRLRRPGCSGPLLSSVYTRTVFRRSADEERCAQSSG
jgi:hypothetical protein